MHLERLKSVLPDFIYNYLPTVCAKFDIDGPLRLSHLLGQSCEETGNFTVFVENLNYSGEALWKLFHTHFISADEAMTFAHQPEKIANRIYARKELGNTEVGDGWEYRGRGCLQLTGKVNYESLSKFLGVDLVSNPDPVAHEYALDSAAFFFMKNNLWPICDKGIDYATIVNVTKHVNGGTLNLDKRIEYTNKFYNLLK